METGEGVAKKGKAELKERATRSPFKASKKVKKVSKWLDTKLD